MLREHKCVLRERAIDVAGINHVHFPAGIDVALVDFVTLDDKIEARLLRSRAK